MTVQTPAAVSYILNNKKEKRECEATVYLKSSVLGAWHGVGLDCGLVPGGVRGGVPPGPSPRLLLRLERSGGQGGPVSRVAVAGVMVAASAELRRPPGDVSASATLQAVAATTSHLEGRGAVPGLGWGRHALYINTLHLHLLLVFHPPVLEPDLDLALREAQHARHLNSSERKMLSEMLALLLCCSAALHYLGIIF